MAWLSAALPAFLIGLVVAAYWYRVLRMARKARRRTGRAANLVPPEPLGRVLRVVWGPAVGVWVAHPMFTGAVIALGSRPPAVLRPAWQSVAWQSVAVTWVSLAVVVGCFIATRACWRRMGTAWRMGIDPGERTPLVATGPFAYVRHPIYALSALMMLATVAAVPSPVMAAAGAVHIGLLVWESQREERHLLTAHGETYARYRRRVGRFLPRSLRPYSGDGPAAEVQAGGVRETAA